MKRLAVLLFCLAAPFTYAQDEEWRKQAWVDKGKDAVRAKLRDGPSAQFRDTFFNRGANNIPMTCGYVNSKNAFGGYSGFQRFVSGGKVEATFLEEEVADDFGAIWRGFCQ